MSTIPPRPRYAPIPLPRDEVLLWRGAPDFGQMARRVLHAGWIAAYLGLALLWWVAKDATADVASLIGFLKLAGLVGGVLALIFVYAWAVARSTGYTVTSERVMMRFGIGLPMTVDIPLALVEAVDLKLHADGSGDVALCVSKQVSVSYAVFWPHVRPWHLRHAQPTLRAIANAEAVAQRLSRALAEQAAMPVPALAVAGKPRVPTMHAPANAA